MKKPVVDYYQKAKAMIESGKASSFRGASRLLAGQTGEGEGRIRHIILRCKDKEERAKLVALLARARLRPTEKVKKIRSKKAANYIHLEQHDVSNARTFALMAISQLERINLRDPLRTEALNGVVAWINDNLYY